jgi:hypothetical protein
VTVDRPEGIDFATSAVSLGTPGRSPRRTRFVVAGWLLALTAVAAVGVGGRERTPTPVATAPEAAAAVTFAATPAPSVAPAPTIRASVTHGPSRRPVPQYRSLGEDGLVGGIVFGDNIPTPDRSD